LFETVLRSKLDLVGYPSLIWNT